ncbi:ABC transporter ATP-binding protein [Microbacterium thalassium]|uniref:Multidrug/hemolysin transport system ATP-binding protein n=1 Tax=Microbacterium thalassium TaxID=362649 RepID=A0A7X0FQV4_9MICO|nr:ABC transporter ATP-binding protein [Microbacterium thalassium]MBB6391525.1 multidrug/hemolysin transport system ATP-binding protein [Microbacterium thalassium]GLK24081.1 multidrug ABC transporter ATP-binding protein [Microbacterium thalassium]
MAALSVQVDHLTKSYRDTVAVDDISFTVPEGSVFAFVGTNGAGKSTTIGCLTTILPFDAGEVRVEGHDVRGDADRVRGTIGVVFQESLQDPILTTRENLRLRARLSGVAPGRVDTRIGELAELIGLGDFLDRRYGKLSGGQRRRADIARALVHEPSLLFLDEPTAGLDPGSRAVVWNTLHELRGDGRFTIFLTTHYMEETEEADRVCIIDEGRIIAEDTPTRLRAAHSRSLLTVTSDDVEGLHALARAAGADPAVDGGRVQIAVPHAGLARDLLARHGAHVLDFEFRHGRMDDVFLALTGRAATGEDS